MKTSYSDIMFYDETKRTMVSVELKPGRTVAEFKSPQKDLVLELQALLNRHHLEDDFRVDPNGIATNVESKRAGKALGARKFIELIEKRGIEPQEYISFGDSVSDYEMFEELMRLGKKSRFVFVGGREQLAGKKDLSLVTFTEQPVDKGTLQYLKSHQTTVLNKVDTV